MTHKVITGNIYYLIDILEFSVISSPPLIHHISHINETVFLQKPRKEYKFLGDYQKVKKRRKMIEFYWLFQMTKFF